MNLDPTSSFLFHLIYYLCPSFPILFIFFAFLFSLLPSRKLDPGSHAYRSKFPHYDSWLASLSREDFSLSFPRRLASNCVLQPSSLDVHRDAVLRIVYRTHTAQIVPQTRLFGATAGIKV